MKQLPLRLIDTPPENPGPTKFLWAGWIVTKIDLPFGGEGEQRQMYGWQISRLAGPAIRTAAYSRQALQSMVQSHAKCAGLPDDLYARGWQRMANGTYLHWPESGCGVGCCFPTLEANIAAARTMRSQAEILARNTEKKGHT